MTRPFCMLVVAVVIATMAAPARAERFGFCEDDVKSATECFLIMTQETYRKCRIVHSMMVIEYGFWESYLPDNNGEKLNFCIDKHRRGIQTPYQAALKEAVKHKEVRAALTDLHQAWQGDLEALIPAIVETQEAYDLRVSAGTEELAQKVNEVRNTLAIAAAPAPAPKKSTAPGKRKRQ